MTNEEELIANFLSQAIEESADTFRSLCHILTDNGQLNDLAIDNLQEDFISYRSDHGVI